MVQIPEMFANRYTDPSRYWRRHAKAETGHSKSARIWDRKGAHARFLVLSKAAKTLLQPILQQRFLNKMNLTFQHQCKCVYTIWYTIWYMGVDRESAVGLLLYLYLHMLFNHIPMLMFDVILSNLEACHFLNFIFYTWFYIFISICIHFMVWLCVVHVVIFVI